MSVAAILQRRFSVRAFRPDPVPSELLHRIFEQAQLAPSNCNVQSWRLFVVSGRTRDRLAESLLTTVRSGAQPAPDFDWHMGYAGEYRERQIGAAMALYGALGIGREDREARTEAMVRNWNFFGAPHAVFFAMDKTHTYRGAVDLGIYAQTLALLLEENGISCCMQGALNQYPGPVRELLSIPDELGILFGMSFGYADPDAPANRTRTKREPLDNAVTFFE
jgi:nitroreductase